jgi:hypothetical protein
MIQFQPVFAGHGGVYQPEPGRLVLDMGNQTVPGIIDHHQEGAPPECAATLIVRQPGLVLDHLAGQPIGAVTFWLHRSPDFDAIAAAYLAQELIINGCLPPGAAALAEYALRVDNATLPPSDHLERTPYGILAGINYLLDDLLADTPAEEAQAQRDYQALARGLELMQFLAEAAADGSSLYDPAVFRAPHPFQAEEQAIRADHQRYLADLAGGRVRTLAIPAQTGGDLRRVS